jgi:hypothetical protein
LAQETGESGGDNIFVLIKERRAGRDLEVIIMVVVVVESRMNRTREGVVKRRMVV